MGELLPCPFCGSEAEIIVSEDDDGRFAAVSCPKCGAGSRQHYFCGEDAREFAADAWNTRPRTEGRGETNEHLTKRSSKPLSAVDRVVMDEDRERERYALLSASPIREPEISREALIKLLADHFGFRPYEQMAEDKSDLRGKIRDGYDYDINEPTRSHLSETADAILNLAPVGGRGEGWRPIETAPKDGTRVLAWPGHLAGGVTAAVETWWYEHPSTQGWITDAFDCGDYEFAPTCWAPLPPPPQEQANKESQTNGS